jgi:Ca2+-binding EF-hand superfamily protein
MLTREVSVEMLKRGFTDPTKEKITEAIRNKYYTEYFKRFAEKWHKNDNLIHRQLEKITSFSKEEIQVLQTEFLKLLKKKKRSQKNLPEINGITKDDFISIMSIIFQSSHLSKRALLKRPMDSNSSETTPSNSVLKRQESEGFDEILIEPEREAKIVSNLLGEEKEYDEEIEGISRDEEDYAKIFDIFDDDKSGSLDFREFLCGMSLLMRGKIAEKIELCFYLFDKENRGYLEFPEFETMMDVFIKSVKITLPPERCRLLEEGTFSNEETPEIGETTPNNSQNIEKIEEITKENSEKIGKLENNTNNIERKKGEEGFRWRMKENFGRKEKLFLSDLLILQKDEFIEELSRAYGSVLRKGETIKELGGSLDKMK